MELRQLRSLVVVAEEAQFSRAALRLGISQPSLSGPGVWLADHLGSVVPADPGRDAQRSGQTRPFVQALRRGIPLRDRVAPGADAAPAPGLPVENARKR